MMDVVSYGPIVGSFVILAKYLLQMEFGEDIRNGEIESRAYSAHYTLRRNILSVCVTNVFSYAVWSFVMNSGACRRGNFIYVGFRKRCPLDEDSFLSLSGARRDVISGMGRFIVAHDRK